MKCRLDTTMTKQSNSTCKVWRVIQYSMLFRSLMWTMQHRMLVHVKNRNEKQLTKCLAMARKRRCRSILNLILALPNNKQNKQRKLYSGHSPRVTITNKTLNIFHKSKMSVKTRRLPVDGRMEEDQENGLILPVQHQIEILQFVKSILRVIIYLKLSFIIFFS